MSYRVAVRALCEFSAKSGDLDLRFTPSPSAQEGMLGHRTVAARRSPDYQSEVPVEGRYGELLVKGRADGYDPQQNLLEEIKTYRGDLARMPDNHRQLHWAQARVYAWLLCQSLQLPAIRVSLVYFDIQSEEETAFVQEHSAEQLQAFFNQQCAIFLSWAQQELQHRALRDQGTAELRFPHGQFRPGQRHLAESVYKAVSTGRCLLAQAPTGIGKTLGTLFPMLKAMAPQRLDKLLFLTAKTPGRQLALEGARMLFAQQPGLPLRVLELVARDKACEYLDKACHGESCPLAKGFYQRLPAARQAAVQVPLLDRQALRQVALEHQVCPYYLSQEMARWSDLVVADYNYYFDSSALLFGLAQAAQERLAVLVDEAHNLVERGRGMYSASLDQQQLAQVRKSAPQALKSSLQRLNREWNALHKEQLVPYQVYQGIPAAWLKALGLCIAALGDYFAEHPQGVESGLQGWYFELLQFARVAELFDEQPFIFDVSKRTLSARRSLSCLSLRNVVPAALLRPRMEAARSVVLFSATLNPRHYYQDLLGLPEDSVWVDVESPFAATQLEVHIVKRISTRYAHRQQSLGPIVELMARQFAARPGNYLAFFSSFDYLQQVAELLAREHPHIPLWLQARGMDEAAREDFLRKFQVEGQGIGFAVLGGAFGEGIDLPGSRLIGAFVATLGLPQLNVLNEQMKQRMGELFGCGYDYTYLYPGLQKVVQAAGRVIRSQADSGVLMLIDDRFNEPRVRRLLPRWWAIAP
ncbi:ATP-dependent DNA helicase [Pseudomonas sessilinigenes]|uniref:ATP-dependent DNA helicase n=1 Tax=Pseudomonas sessilinigenes TaxID=658629 RepID=A0ABX8N068_9PSED|nr:ATP-dependent DNA helicase [Pseudomonas sessilinigenes]AZC24645.1 DinG family ATP-dependent helicase [Pseudomonas sessilinigenes]QXH43570.1 ATP-dependent DNA helicase [Pseudomonas sessilinigenes]